ncbi:MAG: hypothetical protein BME93_04400 [Methanosarcinales archaeon Met12]|nr:MAG: hypothetical protein BME93_04400 [Methanosarcinales archaeon Met12]
MTEEEETTEVVGESAEQVIDRVHKEGEAEHGPIYLSKYMHRDFIELYRNLKKEYNREFAAEEVKRRMKMLTKQQR